MTSFCFKVRTKIPPYPLVFCACKRVRLTRFKRARSVIASGDEVGGPDSCLRWNIMWHRLRGTLTHFPLLLPVVTTYSSFNYRPYTGTLQLTAKCIITFSSVIIP